MLLNKMNWVKTNLRRQKKHSLVMLKMWKRKRRRMKMVMVRLSKKRKKRKRRRIRRKRMSNCSQVVMSENKIIQRSDCLEVGNLENGNKQTHHLSH